MPYDANSAIPRKKLATEQAVAFSLPILGGCYSEDGSLVTTASGTGRFRLDLDLTDGGYIRLKGNEAFNSTTVDKCCLDIALPECYVPGSNFKIRLSASCEGVGTPGPRTIDVELHRICEVSGQYWVCDDFVTTAAQTLKHQDPDNYDFDVNGADFNPGDRCFIRITTSVQETAMLANLWAQIDGIQLLLDIKG